MITAALLAGVLSRDLLFGAVFLIGCARAFELPTAHALAARLVPAPLIPRAVAAWTSANQIAVICGPALGGADLHVSPVLVGVLCLVFFTASITLDQFRARQRPGRQPRAADFRLGARPGLNISARGAGCSASSRSICSWCCSAAPPRCCRSLPRDILAVGPIGLGLLRSAPAAGALDHLDRAVAASGRAPYRPQDVRRGRDLRRGDHRVRAVDLVSAFAAGAGRARRLRRGEHRDPLFAGADRNARRQARAGERDQLSVRRLVEYAGRIRIRRGRRLARRGALGADRRGRLAAGRRHLDAIVPRSAPHRPLRAGGR